MTTIEIMQRRFAAVKKILNDYRNSPDPGPVGQFAAQIEEAYLSTGWRAPVDPEPGPYARTRYRGR